MTEFWVSSGHHLTQRTAAGDLAITDELILAYLARPELVPPEDACAAERGLHARLLGNPRRAVPAGEVEAIADGGARENWHLMLAFRELLLDAPTIEAAYLELSRGGFGRLPPLFANQLTHLILRNALDGCDDPYVLRAGELFFRPQRASRHDGALLLADAEIIEEREAGSGRSPLAMMLGREPAPDLDVLDDDNAWTYWSRSDAFTMAFNLGTNPNSRAGLATAIESWVRHLLGIKVRVEPIAAIADDDWRWFVGLDAEATRIGNAIWQGQQPGADALSRVIGLHRLTVPDPSCMEPEMAGHPIYLLLAVDRHNVLRMKPQNLIVGLPVKAAVKVARRESSRCRKSISKSALSS